MKFQPDHFSAQSITGYGPGWIRVGAEKITTSLILGTQSQHTAWPCTRFEALRPDYFAQWAASAPPDTALFIFGSGLRTRFLPPAWLQPFMARHMGVETMDTLAACRTYNILLGEGRHVMAALLLETPDGP